MNGHYGTDTRPPSAITDLTWTAQGSNDVLTFTAVGDIWKCGTAASYQLFTSGSPITQGNLGGATRIAVTQAPHAAGTRETITIRKSLNRGFLAIRAVDAAGNIGPLPLTAAEPAAPPQLGLSPVLRLPVALMGVAAAFMPRRRRQAV